MRNKVVLIVSALALLAATFNAGLYTGKHEAGTPVVYTLSDGLQYTKVPVIQPDGTLTFIDFQKTDAITGIICKVLPDAVSCMVNNGGSLDVMQFPNGGEDESEAGESNPQAGTDGSR